MKIYIDFDGVIFDTINYLFDENYYKMKQDPNFDTQEYVTNADWYNLILKSGEINDSISILKELKEALILTKVNSLFNEGASKVKVLRELGVKNDIILVPFCFKKTEIVGAKGNILVDDTVHNLDEWEEKGGIPLFFNGHGKDIDDYGKINTRHRKIKSLASLKEFI